MKRLSIEEIRTLEFNSKAKGITIKHTELFTSDEDMILTLATIAKHDDFKVVNGQQWFTLAAKALEQGWELSEKQMTQLRRLGYTVVEFLTHLLDYNKDITSIMIVEVEEKVERVEVEVDEDDLNLADFMDAFFGTESTDATTETETVTAPEAKEVNVTEMQVVEVTYTAQAETFTKKALVTKVTPKTVKLLTRNNELIAIERTIKKSNIVRIEPLTPDVAEVFITSCSELKKYRNKLNL